MDFSNSNSGGYVSPSLNLGKPSIEAISEKVALSVSQKSLPLSAPMIDRVHKAKSGCSACGKKVA